MTTIIPIPAFQDNYIWIMVHRDRQSITCVDPGLAAPVLNAMQQHGWTLEHILITHHHADHMGGVADLLKQSPNCHVYAPNDARIPEVTHPVTDQSKITIDTNTFTILAIPGHTSSHIAYYEAKQNWLFCGDTLFSAGCGRVFDGTLEQLYATLQKIKQLPEQTQLYCGHEYTRNNLAFAHTIEPENTDIEQYKLSIEHQPCSLPSTIALEKKVNPFLRTDQPALHAFALSRKIDPKNQFAIFKQLRQEKDRW